MKQRSLFNSFLISIIINLTLLLVLSILREHGVPQTKSKVDVDFVSLPKARVFQRRSISIEKQTDQAFSSDVGQMGADTRYLTTRTYRSIVREVAPLSRDTDVINSLSDADIGNLPSLRFRRSGNNNLSPAASSSSGTGRSSLARSGSPSGAASGLEGKFNQGESKARIAGSGNTLEGYYNMSLVKYEDSSDNISSGALAQLAIAMNKWTQVRTKVIKESMRLDDPKLIDVPLIYITSRRPFAFSERERQNLQRYFANGGFMMFSNSAANDTQKLEVANSIGFELWKILGEAAHNLINIERRHYIYSSFFPLQKSSLPELLGITLGNKTIVIYDDSGYGAAWVAGKNDKREPYMEIGVNIIAYALMSNPRVSEVE